MFFKTKPNIDTDELDWQLDCWAWLLENLGGLESLKNFTTVLPSHQSFPKSGKKNSAHAEHVFGQVCAFFGIEPQLFELIVQEKQIDPKVGPFHVIQDTPNAPLGTYTLTNEHAHIISYTPELIGDLESLIATFAHEICHPILLSIQTEPPGGGEAEEFATDLAMVFHGFGIFGGNTSFKFQQFTNHDNQGWSFRRSGYLTQNEWSFAIAFRTILLEEKIEPILKFCSDGLASGIKKNSKFLKSNPDIIDSFR